MAAQTKFTTCTFILKKCDFSSPSLASTCVKNFCQGEPYGFGSCTADFTGVPAECCSQSTIGDVAQCMANFQQRQGYGVFGDACLSVGRYVTECENANSGFDNASLKQQARCLCYDSNGNFAPDTWDNAVATCVSTGERAHPTIWSALQKNPQVIGLCTKFAGAAAAPTGPATTGPIPTDTASVTPTGDVSPGTTAADTASPTETGSTAAGTTGSSNQTPAPSSATSSSAAAATTTSRSAAVRVGEMSYSQIKWAAVGLGLMLPAFMMTL